MGFSFTLLATSKVYSNEHLDQFLSDFGAEFKQIGTTTFDEASSMDFSDDVILNLSTLEKGSLVFANNPEHISEFLNIAKGTKAVDKLALVTVEEHSMVMVAQYYKNGILLRDFVEENLEKTQDMRHPDYNLMVEDGSEECMAIVNEVVGQSFYSIDLDEELTQLKWADHLDEEYED